MPIRNATMRNSLANAYKTAGPYGALFTADPGTSGSVSGEVSGGSPAYTRPALNWGTPSNGVVTGAGSPFNVPAGNTITYFGVTTSSTPATADLQDSVAVTSQQFASQGTYTVTPTATIT